MLGCQAHSIRAVGWKPCPRRCRFGGGYKSQEDPTFREYLCKLVQIKHQSNEFQNPEKTTSSRHQLLVTPNYFGESSRRSKASRNMQKSYPWRSILLHAFLLLEECDHVTCECGHEFCWDCGIDRRIPLAHDNRRLVHSNRFVRQALMLEPH